MIWDLTISGIKNFSILHIEKLANNNKIMELINLMYKISIEKAFT
jgi:hypothetical protein